MAQTAAGLAAIALGTVIAAAVTFRAGLAARFRRPARPALPGVTSVIEAHVAAGSLSGIAPSAITHHLLLVVTRDGDLSVTGTACEPLAALVLTQASGILASRAYAAHVRGGEPS